MTENNRQIMKQVYEVARDTIPGDYGGISEVKYCTDYGDDNFGWRIGPFTEKKEMAFKKIIPFNDPTDIGWESHFIFNPSLIEHEGRLYMFYRAAPRKESLSCRIGLSIYDAENGWNDLSGDPVIYPTEDDETHGTEDPKVYKHDGKFYMFYQGNCIPDDKTLASIVGDSKHEISLVTATKLAVSTDLVHWEKKGITVPYSISHGWSKGAVIPRNPKGEAVKINGKFLMFVSEGCGGFQHIGYSDDMVNWTFEKQEFLKLPPEMGSILEVSCCAADYNGSEMILDFFYLSNEKTFEAAQARYSMDKPFEQLELGKGGTLAWGGLIQYNGEWIVAQGWDAPVNVQEMYIYSAKIK